MAHGAGGKAMKDLIDEYLVAEFADNNQAQAPLEDQARIDLPELLKAPNSQKGKLAFTTDSYVIFPLFFPGGDIGRLAVAGTVNDLSVGGAKPLYLSCSLIIEEGFDLDDLRKIIISMQKTAKEAGVSIVTGDTKVVEKGAADKLFINTAGIGLIAPGVVINAGAAKVGDIVIINGTIGDHGASIVASRQDLALETNIQSDCRPLNHLIQAMLDASSEIHCLRDATRGGIATVLNEFAEASKVGIRLNENALPIKDETRGVCELLGLDPLYLANEGKIVAVVAAQAAGTILDTMKRHGFEQAAIIGEVIAAETPQVTIKTTFGGEKMVDLLTGDQLPRIC